MSIQRVLFTLLVVVFVAGCASAPSRPVRSEFEDIPVPKGLSYQPDKSTIIESPTVKAARLVYRGRLEAESLSLALRTTFEANPTGRNPLSASPLPKTISISALTTMFCNGSGQTVRATRLS